MSENKWVKLGTEYQYGNDFDGVTIIVRKQDTPYGVKPYNYELYDVVSETCHKFETIKQAKQYALDKQ
ncbi:MAG: hypothetical protein GQ474_08085 [Sulfurimonas sp.]|nr:hypothetical protein [Sulfurimonas sp.]